MGIKTRLCFLLLMFLMPFFLAHADENVALVVELVDGTTQEYAIGDDPRVTFDETNALIKSVLVETTIPKDMVERFYFEFIGSPSTGIDEAVASKSWDVSFNYDGYTINITGAGHSVLVYDIAGHLLNNVTTVDGTAAIDLSMLNHGIYIIKTNNQTFKILRK